MCEGPWMLTTWLPIFFSLVVGYIIGKEANRDA